MVVTIRQRKGIAYIFCTDQRLVWAFNGLTLDGKPLIRKEVKKIPIETVDGDKVKVLTQISLKLLTMTSKSLTQSSDSKSSSPPSVCASDSDVHIVVGVSKSSSWADDVEDDDFFNKPLVFNDTTANNVENS